ncbi:hypothetical protein PILCRDRAFT_817282 [Piloderma croceum F 1598]|uniref:Uncharacterized protein n=1 Tax=Piloderma croceum (strain F 1598) TaxID=765440 RepID=A0A0C3G3U6_PILCF|nr:hypothetical protein PILCRDRAFT_817282 [Piloderma croceum F 1598]
MLCVNWPPWPVLEVQHNRWKRSRTIVSNLFSGESLRSFAYRLPTINFCSNWY